MRTKRTIALIVVAVMVVCSVALATPQWQKVFNDTYKPKPGTALAKASCVVCHTKMGQAELNAYGKMLCCKPANAASLKSIEKKDADKDKVSNIAELKAGTLPGDVKSKPAKKK